MTLPCVEHALPGIRGLTPYQPGKPIEELQRELGLNDVIKLASNENPLGAPPSVHALLAASAGELNLYPDGSGFRLKGALSRHLGVTPDQVTLGNGSNEILELLARVFLAPGRSAVFSEYAFAVYPLVTQATGGTARVARALPATDRMPYGHDLEAFVRLVDESTRLVFIANPNNPTGTWLEPQEIERFVAKVPATTIVVLDEAYQEYMSPELRPDSLELLSGYPNLVLTRTFSKVYGLAALRIGYAVSHPEVADLLNRARQPFNNNSLALQAAETALADQDHVARSVRNNREGLESLSREIRRAGLSFLPSQANFLTFDLGRSSAPVYDALLRQGVIVRPLGPYGMPTHLRVTIGTPAGNERFVAALRTALN